MSQKMNRREAMALGAASLAALAFPKGASAAEPELAAIPLPVVQSHDRKLQRTLDIQVTDPQSRWCGSIPDQFDLHHCNSAAGFLRDAVAAYLQPQSQFHGSSDVFHRIELAAAFLTRSQNDEGNIDLLSTNFNSPPDTAFVVHNVAAAAKLAKLEDNESLLAPMKDFLQKAGGALVKGGIHTPNHRWVVCAALAQIHDVFPDKRYLKRIDQWLAEGIDIDEEGQFTERSTAGYNAVVDNALVTAAHKLNRPELLEPVRKNLDAMAYLLHPNGEVVTEISYRQDQNTRGTMGNYWFALRYMASQSQNGLYTSMLAPLEPDHIELARLMEYPELRKILPAAKPIPEDYEREYALAAITRIRRGKTSATILHKNNSRWIALRRGEAVINAVRFASAFFGKGQFVPTDYEKRGDGFYFKQEIMGRYLQPLEDPTLFPVTPETWPMVIGKRKMSEVCHMVYEGQIRETATGFELAIHAHGTDNVPLAVEINLREGGQLTGLSPAPGPNDAFLLKEGYAEYRMGADGIRIGPGKCEHAWVELRGAQAKLSGPSVYLTGYAPFEHTLVFEMI
jgi:hypothetical protein